MKIAITSTGISLYSLLDQRFGRCSYFAIYDSETEFTQFIKNPHKEDNEGAGPAAAQFVIARGITKVVSGEFGGKAKSIFENLQIQMIEIENAEKQIQDIINEII